MASLFTKTARAALIELMETQGLKDRPVILMLRDRTYGDSVDGVLDTSHEVFVIVKNTDMTKIRAIVPWDIVEHIRVK